ncbi:aminodeoxychorismate synthase component 1 [Vibrio tubiashii]|uniref:aminodeoxychorismate synthase component 1 n=1 Tax=Vibrio tubiashii TaxID=29498 RepID=UPI001EFE775D|nr:aminodeoxychorismate synthase component 1 [Vibrio tubiashii]MCG9582301.1 aminodeoxychorismate synthase component 1 [Vibrio tubiashii]MCG9615892.1 aminodeoxychorismate synthase component 1 [Vibrio tubiashii]MCG9688187.1 aminodeoxychorismate synthase component 1 [Vibrio tubiashii]
MNNIKPNRLEIKPIPYQLDLAAQHFANIHQRPWAMLLRSPSRTHVDSRFDILVAEPKATITTLGDESYIVTEGVKEASSDNPFELLKRVQDQVLPNLDYCGELPFIGGALGYFSYDLGRRVERMPSLAKQDLVTPDMAIGLYDWALIVDHKEKSAYVVGSDTEEKWQWLTAQQENKVEAFALRGDWQSNMTKASYSSKFAQVQEYLRSGDCYQINLAQRFSAPYQGCEWQAYQKLEDVNQGPFSAFVRTEYGAILSVSPERFLQVKDNEIETKPIKGTRPRFADPQADRNAAYELANAEKDQAENLMIVDLLRNDVGRVAKPGSVHVPKLFDIESFPAVHHLVSTICAKLDDQYCAADLLKASFPGGSITGAPKIRAMEIIEELEPHRRSAYCGSIGYVSRHGRMDTSITIRTLVAENGNIHVWAGGGLVADSQCEAEYQETLDKLSKILPILE